MTVGDAATWLPDVVLRAVAGLQVYVEAPFAVNVTVVPEQITVLEDRVSVGLGVTFTTTVVELVQAPEVPVMTYVVVEGGPAITTLPVVVLRPVAGLQAYDEKPVPAVKVVVVPLQIAKFPFTVTVLAVADTVNTAVAVLQPVASATVTV